MKDIFGFECLTLILAYNKDTYFIKDNENIKIHNFAACIKG
jgi:hypothetical protein